MQSIPVDTRLSCNAFLSPSLSLYLCVSVVAVVGALLCYCNRTNPSQLDPSDDEESNFSFKFRIRSMDSIASASIRVNKLAGMFCMASDMNHVETWSLLHQLFLLLASPLDLKLEKNNASTLAHRSVESSRVELGWVEPIRFDSIPLNLTRLDSTQSHGFHETEVMRLLLGSALACLLLHASITSLRLPFPFPFPFPSDFLLKRLLAESDANDKRSTTSEHPADQQSDQATEPRQSKNGLDTE